MKSNRKNTYYTKHQHHQGSIIDRLLVIFIILTLLLAGISAVYTLYQKHIIITQQDKKQMTETKKPAKTPIEKIFKKTMPSQKGHNNDTSALKHQHEPDDKALTASNEPKYDFYQLLPKMTVDVPKPAEQAEPPATH